MSFIFPVYTLGRSTPGALSLPSATPVFPYAPEPEIGATGHWLFGGSGASLTPFGGTATLTPQGAGHTYGANYVETPSQGNALLSNMADQATMTHCAVIRYQPNAGKNTLVLGNMDPASNGFAVWINGSGAVETILRGNTPALVNHGVPAGVSPGDWLFISHAVTLNGASDKTVWKTQVGAAVYTGEFTGLRSIAARAPALGNAYQTSATYTPAPIRYAEAISFQGMFKSNDELAAIRTRSIKRCGSRGLVVK